MNKESIQIGDTVECVNDFDTTHLRRGKTYIVKGVDNAYLYLEDMKQSGGWDRNRFKKLEVVRKEQEMRNIELEDD